MTPTLLGRWQTRLLLLETIGLIITLLFCGGVSDLKPFWVLQYVALLGCGWDILYQQIQQRRWDQDWPALFQWAAALWEACVILILAPSLPGLGPLPLELFAWHYSLVWIAVFVASQSWMRLLFPYWRFRGGQWW